MFALTHSYGVDPKVKLLPPLLKAAMLPSHSKLCLPLDIAERLFVIGGIAPAAFVPMRSLPWSCRWLEKSQKSIHPLLWIINKKDLGLLDKGLLVLRINHTFTDKPLAVLCIMRLQWIPSHALFACSFALMIFIIALVDVSWLKKYILLNWSGHVHSRERSLTLLYLKLSFLCMGISVSPSVPCLNLTSHSHLLSYHHFQRPPSFPVTLCSIRLFLYLFCAFCTSLQNMTEFDLNCCFFLLCFVFVYWGMR